MATSSPRAVFVSYASQDAEAAERLTLALQAVGIEVWLDRSELRGGDSWDQSIRQHILDCRLFLPIISANTEARSEGYFRREWKLAVDRTRDMSERLAFIVPVTIDETKEARADVPEIFRAVQWTRLPAGNATPAFVDRILGLLERDAIGANGQDLRGRVATSRPFATSDTRRWKTVAFLIVPIFLLAMVYFALNAVSTTRQLTVAGGTPSSSPITTGTEGTFNPPAHSIAVLPFVNVGGDKEQEYFSDGLTEELLNALVRINELQVAARTSSFSFKGKNADIATIAHKLNVGAILEGSVRRAGRTVRVTTELTNAATGFHLWSQTYDRQLSDVLRLQADIANAVADALKVKLLGVVALPIQPLLMPSFAPARRTAVTLIYRA
jgi:TolB-like protein